MRSLARPLMLFVCLAAGAGVDVACSSPPSTDSSEDDVTNIPQTGVTDQGQAGNCWLYATAAWVESLHAARTGDTTTHYSPAYWHYWDLYDQIVGEEIAQTSGQVQFGGFWARAVDIVDRYGLMTLGAFAQDDAAASVNALAAVNASLTQGALAAPGAHQNRALVIQVLNTAFNVSPAVATTLGNTFGLDGQRTFRTGANPADPSVISPHDLPIWSTIAGSGPVATTLDQVLGVRGAPADAITPRYFMRVGPLAWNPAWPPQSAAPSTSAPRIKPGVFRHMPGRLAAPLGDPQDGGAADPDAGAPPADDAGTVDAGAPAPDPAALRAAQIVFERRAQRALNDGAPLPLGWFVNFKAVDPQGRFHASTGEVPSSMTGGHETLVTDYEVTNVPGIGTIPVGFAANEAQKQAALQGTITFFRTKNSWGTHPSGFLEPLAGYNDLDALYLVSPVDVCPDQAPVPEGGAMPVGTPGVSQCTSFAPLVIDVGLPPGY